MQLATIELARSHNAVVEFHATFKGITLGNEPQNEEKERKKERKEDRKRQEEEHFEIRGDNLYEKVERA
ncbi:hypothetical protein K0M31_010048 [Melipona bicolor]|uniref:Uncharacterized protein n=1 Tax=Melipona bicolor TaxID=60889 RepID=A0AA40KIN8_9HYME|nr:hypothetical protein K0M31_010048 [Melipona bicolor]